MLWAGYRSDLVRWASGVARADEYAVRVTKPTPTPRAAGAPATALYADGAMIDGRRLVVFGGCNYLGLAHHPRVVAAAVHATRDYGLSCAASRTTTGNTAAHEALETEIASFFGLDREHREVVCTLDGLTANIAAFESLAGHCDFAVIDASAHRSLGLAARAAGMRVEVFAHGDAADAARVVAGLGQPDRCVVATDTVFASTGVVAPLAALIAALPNETRLLLDECHSLGVTGPRGRGLASAIHAADRSRVVVTSTLAKAIGAHGGFVLAAREQIARLRRTATAFVGTTPIPPAIAAAAAESFRVLSDEPERLRRLEKKAERLHAGLGTTASLPRVPIAVIEPASDEIATALHAAWDQADIRVPLISYPGGPARPYFRISVTSEHDDAAIDEMTAIARRMLLQPASTGVHSDA